VGQRDLRPLDPAQPVHVDIQRAAGGDPRVKLAHRARGGVARVGEERQPLAGPVLVQLLEALAGQEHLAADLEPGREIAPKGERNAPDGPQVLRDVLAAVAVPARGAGDKLAALVNQCDREAVHLQLGDKLEVRLVEQARDALVPGEQLVLGEDVAQAEQRLGVLDHPEGLDRRRAHPLGRRVRRRQTGVVRLELGQLPHQHVVVVVADLGAVQHVVAVVMVVDQLAELFDPLSRLTLVHRPDPTRDVQYTTVGGVWGGTGRMPVHGLEGHATSLPIGVKPQKVRVPVHHRIWRSVPQRGEMATP
jgi:hypothetical protein